ncbi:MAG: hypothetical protein DMG05_06475 [Acidobacteria bacterium]|nr:MAG: hypothetical protein DMG05_06475 [Acidobacteriota bacterium]
MVDNPAPYPLSRLRVGEGGIFFVGPDVHAWALEFGHFHCRVAAPEGRPAFQGRFRQPNPLTRRRATDEIANPNGLGDSSAADAARIPYVGTKVPALKGRPTVRRRDAAAKQCLCAQQMSPIEKTLHGRDLTTIGMSIRVVVSTFLVATIKRVGCV